jgi:hypothetical protein
MSCNGRGGEGPWPNLLSRHFPGGTEKINEELQTGQPISGPSFEPGTPEYQA